MQRAGWVARSARSQAASAVQSTAPQLLFRATRCQEPSRKEYQGLTGAAAREPKYRKYPAAPRVLYSWLPGVG